VNAWRGAINLPGRRRWRDAHAAEERLQRKIDAGTKMPDLSPPVERNNLRNCRRKQIGNKAIASNRVVSVRRVHANFADAHFEHIPGLRALNRYRPSEQMPARSAAGLRDAGINVAQFLLNLIRRQARAFERLRVA